MEDIVRILIIDSNIVYAKRIRTALEQYVRDIKIDLANDVFVTQRRLKTNKYDLIIADIVTIANQELMIEELKHTKAPTIAWTTLSQRDSMEHMLEEVSRIKTITKPYNEADLQEAASIAITTASSSGLSKVTDA